MPLYFYTCTCFSFVYRFSFPLQLHTPLLAKIKKSPAYVYICKISFSIRKPIHAESSRVTDIKFVTSLVRAASYIAFAHKRSAMALGHILRYTNAAIWLIPVCVGSAKPPKPSFAQKPNHITPQAMLYITASKDGASSASYENGFCATFVKGKSDAYKRNSGKRKHPYFLFICHHDTLLYMVSALVNHNRYAAMSNPAVLRSVLPAFCPCLQ